MPESRLARPEREFASSSASRTLTLIDLCASQSARTERSPEGRVPASEHGIGRQDDLVTTGARRYQAERDTAQLGQVVQVLARLGRQLGVVPQSLGGALPPRHLLVHGLRFVPDPLLLGEIREDVPTVAI